MADGSDTIGWCEQAVEEYRRRIEDYQQALLEESIAAETLRDLAELEEPSVTQWKDDDNEDIAPWSTVPEPEAVLFSLAAIGGSPSATVASSGSDRGTGDHTGRHAAGKGGTGKASHDHHATESKPSTRHSLAGRDNTANSAENNWHCPIHSITGGTSPSAIDYKETGGRSSNRTRNEVAQFKNFTKVTSPRDEDSSSGSAISLWPNEQVAITSPRRGHAANETSRSSSQHRANPEDEFSTHYIPYHLLKRKFADGSARSAPPSGVDLRHQCEQLAQYLLSSQHVMQQQQQQQQQVQGERAMQLASSYDTTAQHHHSTSVLSSGGSSSSSNTVYHFSNSTHDLSQQVQRRPSLASVTVEPFLPAYPSAFKDPLVIGNTSKLSRQQQRRPSNPANSMQHHWAPSYHRGPHSDMTLSLESVTPPSNTRSSGHVTLSHITGSDPNRGLVDSRKAPAPITNDDRVWRPAESYAPKPPCSTATNLKPKERTGTRPSLQQTCSLVEMSLPSATKKQTGRPDLARHANSMINFPIIPQSKSGSGKKAVVDSSRTQHHKAAVAAKHQTAPHTQTVSFPKISGIQLAGDQHTVLTTSTAQHHSDLARQSSNKTLGSHAAPSKSRRTKTSKPAGDRHASSVGGGGGEQPSQLVKPKAPGHFVVEWKAL